MSVARIDPPTAVLPPIREIKTTSLTVLLDATRYLASIYNPEVRGGSFIERRRFSAEHAGPPHQLNPPVDVPEAHLADLDLNAIRADAFETVYSVRWLTSLIAQSGLIGGDFSGQETIIERAASLLAICAGSASAGTRSRVFAFSPRSGPCSEDIRVQITDIPLDNQDYTSVGAQTWGGACLLADLIVQSPGEFGLRPSIDGPIRILELGAGTGLVGLAVGKLCESWQHSAEVVMTDFHPSILDNLAKNISSNFPSPDVGPLSISSHFLDWSQPPEHPVPPFHMPFDVIYGADIVYELDHALWIRHCVEVFLRKPAVAQEALQHSVQSNMPSPAPSEPRFHLCIPLRSTHSVESQTIEQVFSFAPALALGEQCDIERRSLAIISRELVLCGDAVWANGQREIEYVHYIIAWV